mgnify:CR=1 FL=1
MGLHNTDDWESVIGSGNCRDDVKGNEGTAIHDGHWFGDLRSNGSTCM